MRHLIDRLRSDTASAGAELLLNVAKQMQNKCLCRWGVLDAGGGHRH
jgi:hypothetical protein